MPDLSIGAKLQRLTATAIAGRWAEAAALADQQLTASEAPVLVMAAAIIHFCNGNHAKAEPLFARALSMDADNNEARLMLSIIDWIQGRWAQSHPRRQLLALDWRSEDEFYGYLVRMLDDSRDPQKNLSGWETPAERSWLDYLAGLTADRRGDLAAAQQYLQQALAAADTEGRVFLLALAKLEAVFQRQLARMGDETRRDRFRDRVEDIKQSARRDFSERQRQHDRLAALMSKVGQPGLDPDQRKEILEQLREKTPDNRTLPAQLAFCQAMQGQWLQALEYVRTYLAFPGRESAQRLSMGLLEPMLLHVLGRAKESREALADFARRTRDAWYRIIAEYLLNRLPDKQPPPEIAANPANLLTAHAALGLWAEGRQDAALAVKHYREALGSYLDHRLEYAFARQRILHLRQAQE